MDALGSGVQEKLKKQKQSSIVQRPINHHRFVNLNTLRVEQALKNPDWNNVEKARRIPGVDPKGAKDGDWLFYPSSKGTDRIVLCIRLFRRDNTVPVFHHIDLLETKSKKMGNNLALGTPLTIQRFSSFLNEDETQFEDLEDVGVNFVKKYVAMFASLVLIPRKLHCFVVCAASGWRTLQLHCEYRADVPVWCRCGMPQRCMVLSIWCCNFALF